MNQAQKTPLVDLLRDIPVAQRTTWPAVWRVGGLVTAPIGKLAHEAADEIDRLTRELAKMHEVTPAMESAAEDYWRARRFKAFSNDRRTWAGVFAAMTGAQECVVPDTSNVNRVLMQDNVALTKEVERLRAMLELLGGDE